MNNAREISILHAQIALFDYIPIQQHPYSAGWVFAPRNKCPDPKTCPKQNMVDSFGLVMASESDTSSSICLTGCLNGHLAFGIFDIRNSISVGGTVTIRCRIFENYPVTIDCQLISDPDVPSVPSNFPSETELIPSINASNL